MPTAEMQAARLARLPRWARDRIALLERNVKSLQATLAQGPNDSDTFADPYADAPRPLGTGTRIKFVISRREDGSSDQYVECYLDGDRLSVRGSDGLAFYPWASNSGYVKVGRLQ